MIITYLLYRQVGNKGFGHISYRCYDATRLSECCWIVPGTVRAED